ncbi:MAG TPA: response regulator [Rectinemataceae bacterium]|nr:response regulator [Rectinemataceae bacterium]
MAERKKVLVVDDMEANRTRIKTFLFMKHFDVDAAEDGLAAKKLLEGGVFDILVSDIEMPNMNGFELLAWVRKTPSTAKMPVIMLSSLDSPEVLERCRRLGATAYIVKPFTKEKIDEAFGKAGF